MKTVTVTINKQGQPRVETQGFTGSECQQATAGLQSALGFTTDDQPTSEMYEPPPQQRIGLEQ